MKIKDYIAKSILQYPGLYKAKNYEESKLQVLNQIFFTLGNGLEFAQTEHPGQGGYIIEPEYVENNHGDWIRLNDEPYGKRTSKPLPKNLFDSESESNYPFHPYSFCDEIGLLSEILREEHFLQDDWMAELVYLCKRTLEFFNDPEQYKYDCYYPSEGNLNKEVYWFSECKTKAAIRQMRHDNGYKPSDVVPTRQEIFNHSLSIFEEYKKRQIKTLEDVLKKFDKTNH